MVTLAQDLVAERKLLEHTVFIVAAGCTTTRECFCLSTFGRDHHENQSSWIVDVEGHYERQRDRANPRIEQVDPDREPIRQYESWSEYCERLDLIREWDEAFSIGYSAANSDRGQEVTDEQVRAALASFAKNPHRGAA